MIPTREHRILWAQKSSATDTNQNFCLLTLVPCFRTAAHKVKVQLAEDGLKMRARGFSIDLQLFDAIDTSKYKRRDRGNLLEVLVYKRKTSDEDWPLLLKPNPESSFDYCESATITPYKNIVENEEEGLRNRLCRMRTAYSENIDEYSENGKFKLLPYWKRPVDLKTWFARANRTVELRNFEESMLLRLPRELRDEIWKFALVDVEPVRMFDGLLPWAEARFARRLTGYGDQFLLAGFAMYRERSRIYTSSKKGGRVVNFFSKPPHCNRGVGLFTTSRAVSRESLEVMYRKTHFVFPDRYGIIGLKCFLHTIGTRNMSNLRKITMHMPPWCFPKFSDQERAGWFYASARAHGLQVAKKHRDPLLGSFDAVLTALLTIKRLRQLDIQISPFMTEFFRMYMRLPRPDDHLGWPIMNRRALPKYQARSDAEIAFLKKLKAVTHRLHVRFVALEYTTDDTEFLNEKEKVRYWNIVEDRCTQWGFDYVKVKGRVQEPPEQGEQVEDDQ